MSGITGCRSCGSGDLDEILSLGFMPLVNSLLRAQDLFSPEARFPLDVVFCRACSLVQITETIPPERLFRNYLYFSSYSDTMLAHAEAHASRMAHELSLGPSSLVLEVGSNDGYLLKNFVRMRVPVLGVEPARNVAAAARAAGVETVGEFFTASLAGTLPKADLVVANNVLAHVADVNGFVEGLRISMKPSGMATVEVPYVKDMVDRCEFDTIYHEHLCYFSVTALEALFSRHGLSLDRIERIPLHGGSLLLFLRHAGQRRSSEVGETLKDEVELGVGRKFFYRTMAHRISGMGMALRGLLGDLKSEGARLAGYGAAAKSATLLNFFGIGRQHLDYVVDRSPHKQGFFMPGIVVPISPTERLLHDLPEYTVLLAWNFSEEILRQQEAYRRRGGKFILPVPEIRIL